MKINTLGTLSSITNPKIPYRTKLLKLNIFNPSLPFINIGAKVSQNQRHIVPVDTFLSDKIKHYKLGRKDNSKNISAWYINPQNSKDIVFYIHGLGKNITEYQNLYKKLVANGMGVFAVEYRAHGQNPSTFVSERKLNKDLSLAYRTLLKQPNVSSENIVVVGHSMGGALATEFAANHKELKSLILVSPMCNLDTLGERFLLSKSIGLGISPFLYKLSTKFKPLKWLQNMNFNTLKSMQKNNVPTAIVQSKNDSVTTINGASKLIETAKEHGILNKYIYLEKGGHAIESTKEDAILEILKDIYKAPISK